jgi:hypothetical protein
VRRLCAALAAIALCGALGGCIYIHTGGYDPPDRPYYDHYGGNYDPYGDDGGRRHD